MATKPSEIPILADGAGLPSQTNNTIAYGVPDKATADSLALQIAQSHKKGRVSKRQRDLLGEMYAMHIDGEGDAQYVTILNGSRLRVSPNLDGGTRCSTNLLRPITKNYVSYQTSIPYRVVADPKSGRVSKDKAKVDTIYANHVIQSQRFNELFADALDIAVPYGFCPLHATVREDVATEVYEGVYDITQGLKPVYVDCWVGDPWSMVFNTGATRRSISSATYERVIPLSLVQQAFHDVPWISELKGKKNLPSASRHQRIARKWMSDALHGHPVLSGSDNDGDEMVVLICKEIAPGIDPNYPDGRLVILALSGISDTDEQSIGTPLLLHDSAADQGAGLPGRRFSFVRLYSDQRNDDPYGYPWITPLDALQIKANNLETSIVDAIARAKKAPLAVGPAGGGDDDTLAFEQDGIVEVLNNFTPQYIQYPTQWIVEARNELNDTREQMFRIGGWQASSRGESKSGTPYSAIVTLQQADDSIHGQTNRHVQGTIVEYLQLIHSLTKEFNHPQASIPVQAAGSDYGYLTNSYISAEELSDEPPQFVVVSGFGSTKEAVAQQLINLAQTADASGEPLLTAKQVRQQFPDQSIWPVETDIQEVKKRRAQAINYMIRDFCREFEEQNGELPAEWIEPAAQQISEMLDEKERVERDDDFQLNIETLSELTQDTTESQLVRRVASLRQDMNYEAIAAMQQPMLAPANGDDAVNGATTVTMPSGQQPLNQEQGEGRVAPLTPVVNQ